MLMKKVKLFFTVVTLLFSAAVALAQNVRVSGNVTETNGDAVVAATVQLKGSSTVYAMTDEQGHYVLSVPSDGVLLVSCLGYKDVEVAVSGRSLIDVILESDTEKLDDVIVVAYGTVKREAVTGSVSSMKGDALASAPVTSVDKALSGKMAGVQVTAASGQPGAASQIRIRGYSSISASNAPLWVVDGIPVVSGDIALMTNTSSQQATINPNDIESITVLKDAAAAAAYGSRAANGVILVQTKSGKEGKTQFDARVKYGVNWLQSDSGFRMMTPEELLTYQRDAIVNAGLNPDDPTGTYYRPLSLLSGELTNWMDHFTRLGRLNEYEVTARGGNNKSKYYSSLSYHKNEGVFYGVDYNRFQARINADYKLLDNLETGVRVNASYTDQSDIPMQSLYYANPAWAGLTLLPWIPKYDEYGNHNVNISSNSNQNPRATAEYDDQWQKAYNFNGNMYLRWEPVKNLILETKDGAEVSYNDSRRYWNPKARGSASDPTLQTEQYFLTQYTTSNTITYSNVLNGLHSFRVLAGQEAMTYQSEFYYMYAPGVDAAIPYVNTANQANTEGEYGITRETLLSFLGIADYNYDNRYFVQANIREDGSSLFGANRKWGLFWSASASWNATAEKFMRNVSFLDLLKIRGSYGVNGNNGISAYQAYGLYGSSTYNGVVGMLPSQPSNEDLSWEKNKTWDIGLDFGFLGRFHGTFDYYSRKTEDMLLSVSVPQTTGFSSNTKNIGSMRNRGVEFMIDADIISTEDMYWNVGFNISHNKSLILDLGPDVEAINPSSWVTQYRVGHPMYEYYLHDYAGVNPANGEALWFTEDGSITNDYNKSREVYCGSPEPKVMGGFNTTFAWKGLSLSAFFEYKAGNYVCILNEWSYLNGDGSDLTMNQMASSLNYWKKPGDVGVSPKPVAGNSSNSDAARSTRYLERGDYLRIKDITLSYSFPETILKPAHLKGLKVYVSGLNLYCFNDVNFWDPEMGVTGAGAGVYPLTKSFVGGVEVSF